MSQFPGQCGSLYTQGKSIINDGFPPKIKNFASGCQMLHFWLCQELKKC